MAEPWSPEAVLRMASGYREACVLGAAAELDVFGLLADEPMAADAVAARLEADSRATAVLLDAVAAIGLLDKRDGVYACAPGAADVLTASGSRSALAMTHHLTNCLRSWAQLARVVKTGVPADRVPSIRGEAGDRAAFIGGMDDLSRSLAPGLVAELGPPRFRHLLDVGGASGTWTIAFLKAVPEATATLFDLPPVIPMAERRLAEAGVAGRVTLVAGDYEADPLPPGADLAWVSAIVHQNSMAENRALLGKVYAALAPGGRILIRDVVMAPSRTRPAMGALFAINMLVATPSGGTYTLAELSEALEGAGFVEPTLLREADDMNSVVGATKPA